MLSTGLFEMRAARLVSATAATLMALVVGLLLAPSVAHAWEVSLSIKGAGTITETTSRNLIAAECPGGTLESSNQTPTGVVGAICSPGSPSGVYSHGDIVEYRATPKTGFTLVG